MNIGEAIGKFVALRDKKSAIQKRHQDELAPFNETLKGLENYFLNHLNTTGTDRASGEAGTVYRLHQTSAKVEDWDATLAQIKANDLFHLLEKRVSKAAVEEYTTEHGAPPAGVSISRSVTVGIRRS